MRKIGLKSDGIFSNVVPAYIRGNDGGAWPGGTWPWARIMLLFLLISHSVSLNQDSRWRTGKAAAMPVTTFEIKPVIRLISLTDHAPIRNVESKSRTHAFARW